MQFFKTICSLFIYYGRCFEKKQNAVSNFDQLDKFSFKTIILNFYFNCLVLVIKRKNKIVEISS